MSKFVELNENGDAVITLATGLDIDGTRVKVLVMREPDVKDQLIMDAIQGGDAAKELGFFANLTGQTPALLQTLKMRDYKRVQAAFALFID
jgi:hypothetical protein